MGILEMVMEIIGIWFLLGVGVVMIHAGIKELYIRNFNKKAGGQ